MTVRRKVSLKPTLDATPVEGREGKDPKARLFHRGSGNLPMNFPGWVELIEHIQEARNITKGWTLTIELLGGWTFMLKVDWTGPHDGSRKRIAVRNDYDSKYTVIYDSKEQE